MKGRKMTITLDNLGRVRPGDKNTLKRLLSACPDIQEDEYGSTYCLLLAPPWFHGPPRSFSVKNVLTAVLTGLVVNQCGKKGKFLDKMKNPHTRQEWLDQFFEEPPR